MGTIPEKPLWPSPPFVEILATISVMSKSSWVINIRRKAPFLWSRLTSSFPKPCTFRVPLREEHPSVLGATRAAPQVSAPETAVVVAACVVMTTVVLGDVVALVDISVVVVLVVIMVVVGEMVTTSVVVVAIVGGVSVVAVVGAAVVGGVDPDERQDGTSFVFSNVALWMSLGVRM